MAEAERALFARLLDGLGNVPGLETLTLWPEGSVDRVGVVAFNLAPYRDPGSPYAAALAGTDAAWARVYRFAPGPAAAGRAVARAATTPRPAPRYVVPAGNRLLVAALTALPTPAADAAKRRIMGLPGRPRLRRPRG